MFSGKTAFVAHVTLVKGVPFYGYHVGYDFFLKVYMLNPSHMTRLADLLRQGAIMKRVIQPYESHMQYIPQWMCDHNLYGCAYIECKRVKFRSPIPKYLEMSNVSHKWHDRTIDPLDILDEDSFSRQSHCSIEVDVCVADIMNRNDVKPRDFHHDFIEKQHSPWDDQKLVQSMAGLWRDETRRRKLKMGLTGSTSTPFPPDVLVSVSADPRNTRAGGWIHEEESFAKVADIVREEREKSDGRKIAFNGFVSKAPFGRNVKTALESVEDLFEANLKLSERSRSQRKPTDAGRLACSDQPLVDESRLQVVDDDEFLHDSDEGEAREVALTQQEDKKRTEQLMPQEDDAHVPTKSAHVSHQKPDPAMNNSPPLHRSLKNDKIFLPLEAMGIRSAGKISTLSIDSFEVPDDFASNISEERKILVKETSTQNTKKRKRSHSNTWEIGGAGQTPHYLVQERPSTNPESADDLIPTAVIEGRATSDSSPFSPGTRSSKKGSPSEDVTRDTIPRSDHPSQNAGAAAQNVSSASLDLPCDPSLQNSDPLVRQSKSSTSAASSGHPQMGSAAKDMQPSWTLSLDRNQAQCVGQQARKAFDVSAQVPFQCYAVLAPSSSEINLNTGEARFASILHRDAYYSCDGDVQDCAREYAGKEFKIESQTLPYLPIFDASGSSLASLGEAPPRVVIWAEEEAVQALRGRNCSLRTWEMRQLPPSCGEVQNWVCGLGNDVGANDDSKIAGVLPKSRQDLSQIDGATQKNKHGFKYSQRQASTSVQHETQYMSIMSLEVHVNTRESLVPNPEHDDICCVFWCLQSDDEELEVNGVNAGTHVGILALSEDGGLAQRIAQQYPIEVEEESTELDLINRLVDIVRLHDPDILTGYEVHGGSWGYLIERSRVKYDYNLCDELSRVKSQSHGRFGKDDDRWGFNHTSTIRVTGRHMINIWRAMRGELNLLQYTMENVVFQLCHRRIPHYTFSDLTAWYASGKPRDLTKLLDYYVSRVQLDLEILEQNELIPRTSEQARLLGVDFFSVFSRGSQFKVESLMFRIAKPENFLLPSPSRKQVGQQNALECLPLVMEPQSAFYSSPLLVLDFQSLYPSVMIAYNYCYSTYLGRVVNWRGQNKMGFSNYRRQPRILELFGEQINVAPNGIMYVKPEIRKSLLAKMLGEILETRVMVKSGMKVDKDDKTLQRLLNNRQLALKLIANVTYGYTSASFSGRMPCSEIADSIVQTGRETLEKAIALIHSVKKWGAEVVYGDTDSLFVYLKGRSKDEAFELGNEIARTITDMNPRPVKLKFEKVYFPCVLLAKKRYVGFKYESKDQKSPDFDAKGIETVRRDGTPAEQKIEEKALKILFRTADLSQVKEYFQTQCTKIMQGKVSIQDFCFAKEVKLGTYSDKGLPPPGALISTRRMLEDPRAEPQYGERVPYVVLAGAPGARLIDRCVAPEVLLQDETSELDSEYYISKNLIPPLERIFNLMGANVRQWYDEMPKVQRIRHVEATVKAGNMEQLASKKTLESYMKSSSCLVCRENLEGYIGICEKCQVNRAQSLLVLRSRLSKAESKGHQLAQVCRSCAKMAWNDEVRCDSKDCPVFYTRTRHLARLRNTTAVIASAMEILEGLGGKDGFW